MHEDTQALKFNPGVSHHDPLSTITRRKYESEAPECIDAALQGSYLYTKAFLFVRDHHLALRDLLIRSRWVAEWQHKFTGADSNMLDTLDGADAAVQQMLESLGYKYDKYFRPEDLVEEAQHYEPTMAGLGMSCLLDLKAVAHYLDMGVGDVQPLFHISESTPLLIVEIFPGSPAEAAGVRVGDRILAIDGKEVNSKTLEEVMSWLPGKQGIAVTISMARPGEEEPLQLTIVSAIVHLPVVHAKHLDGGVFYIKVDGFSSVNLLDEVAAALVEAAGSTALILDLRGNPGGDLEFAKCFLQLFVQEGTVIVIDKREGDEIVESRTVLTPDLAFEYTTWCGHITSFNVNPRIRCLVPDGQRVIVIANGESASASELTARLLQLLGATVVGENTANKHTGQRKEYLPYGRAIAVTIFEFQPGGKPMGESGVVPDLHVQRGHFPTVDDPQLSAALAAVPVVVP